MSKAHTSIENQKKIYSNAKGGVPTGRGEGEREREREVSNVDGSCVGVTGHRRKLFGCCGLRRVDNGRSDKPTTTTRGGGRVWTLEVVGLGFSNFHFLI